MPSKSLRRTSLQTPEQWLISARFDPVQFIEDTGDVLFYKNARGVAAYAAVAPESQSDSGVDVSADKN